MITILVINAIVLIIALLLLLAEKFFVTYGECLITINGDRTLNVTGGNILLNYLNQNKIFTPSACGGKATCGFCKVKVLSGAGSILPTEEVYITRQEQQEGIRLACQVKVKRGIEIYIPEYLLKAEEYGAEVVSISDVTHDIKYIRLKILNNKRMGFLPGQYIQLKIPGTDEYRAYSIANQPSLKNCIELVIRLVPGGLCSTYVHRVMENGDRVVFTGPFGDFYLKDDSKKEIVAIGGGCGMAPIRSILKHLAEQDMLRKFTYFFGARSTRDLFFTKELRNLEEKFPRFKYIPALSELKPEDKWKGEVGLITQVAEKYISETGEKEAYLCGPPPMIDAAMKILPKKGIKDENIFFDKF